MKYALNIVVLVAASAIMPAIAADVGVSVSIGEPGFYGQIDIGDFPQPRLIYREPIIIERDRMDRRPIYVRAPPGHIKHWRDHCREYNACGQRVYFVEDNWYQHEYIPRYRQRHQNWQEDVRHGNRDRYHGDQDRHDKGNRHDDHNDDRDRGDKHDSHHDSH